MLAICVILGSALSPFWPFSTLSFFLCLKPATIEFSSFQYSSLELTPRLCGPSGPRVWAAYGCHPHFAEDFDQPNLDELKKLLARPNVVALGEIGLDYSYKNNM